VTSYQASLREMRRKYDLSLYSLI